MAFGSGSIGYWEGFSGALIKASFLIALYKSDNILGYKSGIFPKSSKGFSNKFLIILTKFFGFTLNPKSSYFVFTKSTKNRG